MEDDWGYLLAGLVGAVGFVSVFQPERIIFELGFGTLFLILMGICIHGAWTYDD